MSHSRLWRLGYHKVTLKNMNSRKKDNLSALVVSRHLLLGVFYKCTFTEFVFNLLLIDSLSLDCDFSNVLSCLLFKSWVAS